jgi:hypothetical protein
VASLKRLHGTISNIAGTFVCVCVCVCVCARARAHDIEGMKTDGAPSITGK